MNEIHTTDFVEEERFTFDLRAFKATDKYQLSDTFYPCLSWSEEGRLRYLTAYQYKRAGVVPEWLRECRWQLPSRLSKARKEAEELKRLTAVGWMNGRSAGWYDGQAQDPDGYVTDDEDVMKDFRPGSPSDALPVPTVEELLTCFEEMPPRTVDKSNGSTTDIAVGGSQSSTAKRKLVFEYEDVTPVPLATSSPLFVLSDMPPTWEPPPLERDGEDAEAAIELFDSPPPADRRSIVAEHCTTYLMEMDAAAETDKKGEWNDDDDDEGYDPATGVERSMRRERTRMNEAAKRMKAARLVVGKLKWSIDHCNTKTITQAGLERMRDRLQRFKLIYKERKREFKDRQADYEAVRFACRCVGIATPDDDCPWLD